MRLSPLPLLLAAVLAASPLRADVTLAPLFQDHAVLQRDAIIHVWGTADPRESVTVILGNEVAYADTNGDGHWATHLPARPASTDPVTLTVRGKNTITLQDILIGDVWLCGGQSNMEWPVRMTNRAAEEIAAADFPLIRHIRIERRIGHQPVSEAAGSWTVCTPETVPHYTAVGYYFARDLHRATGVPVGLINSNWGGTPIEAWLPPAALDDLEVLAATTAHQAKSYQGIHDNIVRYEAQLAAWRADPASGSRPTIPWRPGAENTSLVLYNGMIAPLVPYTLGGVIWYQGEANADQPATYHTLFPALIESWRDAFEDQALPFYWAQLANWGGGDSPNVDWAYLREAQTATLRLPQTGQAVIIDIGDEADIHPRNKQDVSARLARLARARIYGEVIADTGPRLADVAFADGTATVYYDHADGLHTTDGAAPRAFELAGEDGVFHPATATLSADTIALTSPAVTAPRQVRYAWHRHMAVNLANGDGLPAEPFRTDTFPQP